MTANPARKNCALGVDNKSMLIDENPLRLEAEPVVKSTARSRLTVPPEMEAAVEKNSRAASIMVFLS
jgi:hypothetical protein